MQFALTIPPDARTQEQVNQVIDFVCLKKAWANINKKGEKKYNLKIRLLFNYCLG